MAVKEAVRLVAVREAAQGRITNTVGAARAGLGRRQFLRLKARYKDGGPAGILHGNRGRPSPRRLAPPLYQRVEALLQQEVPLNDHHIRDLLVEEGHAVSADSVRRIRRALGQPPKQRRRAGSYRRRREPMARPGEMVQIDGSPFQWLGPAQPHHTLTGTVDDAEGRILSLNLRSAEDLHGFTQAVRDLISDHGVPWMLYGDRTNIAVRNDRHWTPEEERAGRQTPSHFGQMLEELGIRYIAARSPEAKGRIERLWRTLQDRLAAELALYGHTHLAAAQAYLPCFIRRFNARFARAARDPRPAWRAAPRHLDRILACRYPRTVGRDHTVTIPGTVIHVPPGPGRRSYAGCRVVVRELLDGRLLVLLEHRVIAEQPPPDTTFSLAPRHSRRAPPRLVPSADLRPSPRIAPPPPPRLQPRARPPADRPPRRPATNHPWKRDRWPLPRKRKEDLLGVSE